MKKSLKIITAMVLTATCMVSCTPEQSQTDATTPDTRALTNFTVVNADTGAEIATFTSSGTVSLTNTPRINVRANATSVGSVVFTDGSSTRTESTAPYAYKGDASGKYNPWTPTAGMYTITATTYSAAGGMGTLGVSATLALTITTGTTPPGTFTGKLMIDPDNVHYFVYDRDSDNDGKRDPAYLAGVGGPEGFLYESAMRKQTIVNKLLNSLKLNTPVNGIYFHATRAFGGDGNPFETPFVNNADPKSGLDPNKMISWRATLKQLDEAGIILWFNLLDDHAAPYGCKFNDDYKKFAQDIVNQFKDLKHLIWVTQEEYRWTDGSLKGCPVADSDARQTGLAAAIRAVDSVHAIATHHMNGQAFNFANKPLSETQKPCTIKLGFRGGAIGFMSWQKTTLGIRI
jgi:hypothetical protein